MERSNQPPKTEDCLAAGQPVDLWFYRKERPSRSVSTGKREPQAGPASGLSNSASKSSTASGDDVLLSESKTNPTVKGKDGEGLPGSESVARAEGSTRYEADIKGFFENIRWDCLEQMLEAGLSRRCWPISNCTMPWT